MAHSVYSFVYAILFFADFFNNDNVRAIIIRASKQYGVNGPLQNVPTDVHVAGMWHVACDSFRFTGNSI